MKVKRKKERVEVTTFLLLDQKDWEKFLNFSFPSLNSTNFAKFFFGNIRQLFNTVVLWQL